MNFKEMEMTSKIDRTVSEIVAHMALPTADPKIKNQLARYVKGQIIALVSELEVKDVASFSTIISNHFNPKG